MLTEEQGGGRQRGFDGRHFESQGCLRRRTDTGQIRRGLIADLIDGDGRLRDAAERQLQPELFLECIEDRDGLSGWGPRTPGIARRPFDGEGPGAVHAGAVDNTIVEKVAGGPHARQALGKFRQRQVAAFEDDQCG